jgi:hypothetical protein
MAFPWLAAAVFTSTAVSYMGSIQQSKNLAVSAQWDKYHRDIKAKQDTILANERAKKILSLKRATIGARGVEMGTGSTLIEQAAVIDNLEDTLFWISKGVEMDTRTIDLRLASSLSKEAWERGSSLISGGLNTWSSYKTGKV